MVIRAVVFDLDNVLYDEKDYLLAAYRNIARFLSKHCNLSEDEVYEKLICDFEKKGSMYPKLFNDVLSDLGLSKDLLPEVLRLYASVESPLMLFSDSEPTLLSLRKLGVKLALLTNGNVNTQRNKIGLLNVERYFDVVMCSREIQAGLEKPHPAVYSRLLEKLDARANEILCVGDNPFTDFSGAKQLGMLTVRLLRGEFKNVKVNGGDEADFVVDVLSEIVRVVEGINQ